MAPLRNPRHEKFSQLVASGVRPKEAYTSVGYKPTGAKQAASRLLTKVDVRARVSELQENAARSAAEAVILNRERVLNRLSQLSYEAERNGQYSAAAKCEELIGREIGMFARTDLEALWDGDPARLTPAQLDVIITALARRVYGDNPQAIAEAKKAMLEGRELPPPPAVIETTAEPA